MKALCFVDFSAHLASKAAALFQFSSSAKVWRLWFIKTTSLGVMYNPFSSPSQQHTICKS